MAISIDPNVKAWINGTIAVCGAIAAIGIGAFPDYVPKGIATEIVQTAAFILAVYGGLNTAGNLFSSNQPGALAPADPPSIVAARAVVNLTPDDPPSKVTAVKQAAITAVQTRDPSKGPA
jgi:hypothetical protein